MKFVLDNYSLIHPYYCDARTAQNKLKSKLSSIRVEQLLKSRIVTPR